ncbi:hypothetical protein OIU85_019876, partial [Salix viminalis]
MQAWKFISNGTEGTARIIIGWDSREFSFIYGLNTPAERQDLWAYLISQSSTMGDQAWLLMGDFNATMKAADSYGGDTRWVGHKQDFGQCLHQAQLQSLPYRGLKYTWHNGQSNQRMILKKLDWVVGNYAFTLRAPLSVTAKNKEREAAKQYQQLSLDEESYYKQKSRIQWLMLGDRNTAFFHRSLQHRYSRNKICSITDDEGSTIHDQKSIGEVAV